MIGAARYFNPRYWAERFFPKVGEEPTPVSAMGSITADGTENYIGGSATISTLSGSAAMGVLGGSVAGSVIGGSVS